MDIAYDVDMSGSVAGDTDIGDDSLSVDTGYYSEQSRSTSRYSCIFMSYTYEVAQWRSDKLDLQSVCCGFNCHWGKAE